MNSIHKIQKKNFRPIKQKKKTTNKKIYTSIKKKFFF